jgi:hypothetical protein
MRRLPFAIVLLFALPAAARAALLTAIIPVGRRLSLTALTLSPF